MRRVVVQEHVMGCAVACLAVRANITYDEALSYFDTPRLAWTRGIYCDELVEALRRAGFAYQYDAYGEGELGQRLSRENSIVFVDYCEKYPMGHYLIRKGEEWMNSWANSPRVHPIEARFETELPSRVLYLLSEV